VEAAEEGPIEALWDPESRLLRLAFFRGRPEGSRERLGGIVRAWVGWDEPYDVVVSCESGDAASLSWRVHWSQFFRQHASPPRVACFGLTASERFFLGVMRPLFRMEAQSFDSEGEARAWLSDGATR